MIRQLLTVALLSILFCLSLGKVSASEQYWQSLRLRDHPLVGTVWSQSGEQISFEDLFSSANESHFVLIGEKHDNPDHHALQARIIRELVDRGRRPSIVLEMVPTDLQLVLDNYLASEFPSSAALGAILNWEERGWPRWSFYEPIAEAALAANLPIYGGDLPNNLLRQLVEEGREGLTKKQLKRLSLEMDRGRQSNASLLKMLYTSHCKLVPEEALEPMADVQRARDGSLARTLIKESDGKGAVLIAGNGHVRRDWGVPFVLRNEKPGKTVVSIGILEVAEEAEMPSDYAQYYSAAALPFDYAVFTPAGEDIDYCARFSSAK